MTLEALNFSGWSEYRVYLNPGKNALNPVILANEIPSTVKSAMACLKRDPYDMFKAQWYPHQNSTLGAR